VKIYTKFWNKRQHHLLIFHNFINLWFHFPRSIAKPAGLVKQIKTHILHQVSSWSGVLPEFWYKKDYKVSGTRVPSSICVNHQPDKNDMKSKIKKKLYLIKPQEFVVDALEFLFWIWKGLKDLSCARVGAHHKWVPRRRGWWGIGERRWLSETI